MVSGRIGVGAWEWWNDIAKPVAPDEVGSGDIKGGSGDAGVDKEASTR
jgi:hypothetical protein